MDALIVTPPPLKSTMGPLLGPAILHGAAVAAGFLARQYDLAIRFVRHAVGSAFDLPQATTGLVGDHAKAPGVQRQVDELARAWSAPLVWDTRTGDHGLQACSYDSDELTRVIARAVRNPNPWRGFFIDHLLDAEPAPAVLCISILYGGQVLPAAILSALVRKRWRDTAILWGGPHITALGSNLPTDAVAALVDGFVVGRGETALPELLRRPRSRWADVPGFRAPLGQRGTARGEWSFVRPVFEGLDAYRQSELALPYQLSLGCAYGKCRCAFRPS